jgi:hypothetical protein
MITTPGAYPDIPAELYHGCAHLLPEPSLSSSGAKLLLNRSPMHFWHASPMNPDRTEDDKPHYSVGRAAHDLILLRDRWPAFYHVTPEGFTRAATKKFADAIAEAEGAREDGKTVLSFDQAETVHAIAAALRKNDLAMACLTNGVTEETLAWQDPMTNRWLRARPDFRPNTILTRHHTRVVADLKFVADSHASPRGFERAIENFGYHQSAAFYWDGIKVVHGIEPTHWVHVVVEKDAPHCVSLYELPAEDIERGRWLNRKAIDLFHRCLSEGKWPGYADTPTPVGLPGWARKRCDDEAWNEPELADAA